MPSSMTWLTSIRRAFVPTRWLLLAWRLVVREAVSIAGNLEKLLARARNGKHRASAQVRHGERRGRRPCEANGACHFALFEGRSFTAPLIVGRAAASLFVESVPFILSSDH